MRYYKLSVQNNNPEHIFFGSRKDEKTGDELVTINHFSEEPRIYDVYMAVTDEEWSKKPKEMSESSYVEYLAGQSNLFQEKEDEFAVTSATLITECEYMKHTSLPAFLEKEDVLEHWKKCGQDKTFKLPLSDMGAKLLNYQEKLSQKYSYKMLPKEVEEKALHNYLKTLPVGFLSEFVSEEGDIAYNKTDKPGVEVIPMEKIPLVSREGTLIANNFDRIVIGHYGAFIEIADEDMIKDNVVVKKGQEYRINDANYASRVKYQWFTCTDNSDCKLYYQQKGVTYADYKPGYWYVSPFEVLDKNELQEYRYFSDLELDTLKTAEELEAEYE